MTDILPDLASEIIAGDSITILEIARQFSVSPSTALQSMLSAARPMSTANAPAFKRSAAAKFGYRAERHYSDS